MIFYLGNELISVRRMKSFFKTGKNIFYANSNYLPDELGEYDTIQVENPDLFKIIPEFFTSLSIKNIGGDIFIPNHINKLLITSANYILHNTAHISALFVNSISADEIKQFPNLTTLSVVKLDLTAELLESLPATLKYLDCMVLTVHCGRLPSHIIGFGFMIMGEMNDDLDFSNIQTATIMQYTNRIKNIESITDLEYNADNADMQLPRNLKYLDISCLTKPIQFPETLEKIILRNCSMEALSFLPHSVKQITICGTEDDEELNLSLLPTGIRKLKLQGLKCNLNLLPQNIEELSTCFVQTEFVSKFPTKLRKIKLQRNLQENMKIPSGIQIKIS